MHERLIVVDYDGTITEDDVLDRVAVEFAEEPVATEEAGALDDSALTLHDVLEREYAAVRAPEADVTAWVREHARIRPGFHALVELAAVRGWSLVVLSSGFRRLIDPVLKREGLGTLRVIANDVEPSEAGWRVTFVDDAMCEVCGEACKRRTLAQLDPAREVVYIGDGYSDRCAAESADRVFARAGLARYLERRRIPFEPFETFTEIVRALS